MNSWLVLPLGKCVGSCALPGVSTGEQRGTGGVVRSLPPLDLARGAGLKLSWTMLRVPCVADRSGSGAWVAQVNMGGTETTGG